MAGQSAALFPADRDDEAAIAQSDERLLDDVGEAGLLEESFQTALDGLFELRSPLPEGAQRGTGAVQ